MLSCPIIEKLAAGLLEWYRMVIERIMRTARPVLLGGLCIGLAGCSSTAPLKVAGAETPTGKRIRSLSHRQSSAETDWLQAQLNAHSSLRNCKITVEWTSKGSMALPGTVVNRRQNMRALEIARKLRQNIPFTNELLLVPTATALQRAG